MRKQSNTANILCQTDDALDLCQLHDFVSSLVEELGSGPGSAINLLDKIQKRYRFIPVEALFELSRITNFGFADLCSLVYAFNDFTLEPVGKHLILVCDGTACHASGSKDVIRLLEETLGVMCGCTSEDGEYTLKAVYCVGACSLAPLIKIEGESFGRVRLTEIESLLNTALLGRAQTKHE